MNEKEGKANQIKSEVSPSSEEAAERTALSSSAENAASPPTNGASTPSMNTKDSIAAWKDNQNSDAPPDILPVEFRSSSSKPNHLADLKELEDESASLSSNSEDFSPPPSSDSSMSMSINSLSGLRPPNDDSIFNRIQRFEDASEVDLPLENKRPAFTSVGSVLDNKYRITHKIAEGGMGIVYGAAHTKLGKQVAIKVIAPGTLSNEESRRRFVREAKASTLLSSPHTVRVYDYNVSQWGEPYLVMEFVEGTNLNQILKKGEAFDTERAVHITKQIAQSLMEAHASGLIHRDLKPSNIMLLHLKGHDDFVKIFDFGVVKFADGPEESDLTRQGVVLGTPRYMAPEQITSPKEVSYPADIFSIGLILYYMLTGEKPFGDASQDMVRISRITGKGVHLPKNLEIPPTLRSLYERMTAQDPKRRPTAEEVFEQLKSIENELKSNSFSGSTTFSPQRSGFFGSVYGKASIFLAIPVLLLGVWWFSSTKPDQPTKGTTVASAHAPTNPRDATPNTPNPAQRGAAPAQRNTTPERRTEPTPERRTEPTPRRETTENPPPPRRQVDDRPVPPTVRSHPRKSPRKKSRYTEIRVTSSPSGATVLGTDGEALGKTPLTVKKPNHQPMTLQIKRGGFFSTKLVIPAKANRKSYNVRLREINIEVP